ncbi:MAG: HD domain-containing phosphohydrolase, partial [Dehalococcoidia bacterium]
LRLSARAARALREHGVSVCFVEDAASIGVPLAPLVDATGEDEAVLRALQDTFALVARLVEAPARQSTSRAIDDLRGHRIIAKLDATGSMEALRAATGALAARSVAISPAAGFVTERQATDDLYGHSVGVAALAVRIGVELGLSGSDLAWTALAAVFHDAGMLMVPEEIRRTPAAQRTPAQQRRYQDHTLLGEAILRPLERRAPALPVVALEHHEEQSGGGYPRGMRGLNRILRPANADADRPITLVSEVVALADRYERMVSPAPGNVARSPAAARHIIASEGGSRLNAEVVARFLDILPRWPLGTEVLLRGGAHEGARGVVVQLDATGRDRPVVRVFETADGTR